MTVFLPWSLSSGQESPGSHLCHSETHIRQTQHDTTLKLSTSLTSHLQTLTLHWLIEYNITRNPPHTHTHERIPWCITATDLTGWNFSLCQISVPWVTTDTHTHRWCQGKLKEMVVLILCSSPVAPFFLFESITVYTCWHASFITLFWCEKTLEMSGYWIVINVLWSLKSCFPDLDKVALC